MKNFFKKYSFLAGIFIFLGWGIAEAGPFLYLLFDSTKVGDKNQVYGVAGALEQQFPPFVRKEFDCSTGKQEFLNTLKTLGQSSQDRVLVVAAGEGAIPVLQQLSPQDHIVIAYSSHQYTPGQASLKDVVDAIVLPTHVVTPEIKNTFADGRATLVETIGVPHQLSPEAVQKAYTENKARIPDASPYVGVILGGDAPTPEKDMRYYTVSEAQKLADYLVGQEPGKYLLILNGPRTGKHDQQTGEVMTDSHRQGKLDLVTVAFVEGLKEKGLTQGKDFQIFDFHFGDTTPYYPIVLGALSAKGGRLYVAGESTSMVSESVDCLAAGCVIAYTNQAMNANHGKHLISEQTAGRIQVLREAAGQWTLEKAQANSSQKSQSAAAVVAEKIAECLKNRGQE